MTGIQDKHCSSSDMYLCLRQLAAEVLHLLLSGLLGAQLLLGLALQTHCQQVHQITVVVTAFAPHVATKTLVQPS